MTTLGGASKMEMIDKDNQTARVLGLMDRMRYGVFAPSVTTMGPCPRCLALSRGSDLCGDCLAEELNRLLGNRDGSEYLIAIESSRKLSDKIRKAAARKDHKAAMELKKCVAAG